MDMSVGQLIVWHVGLCLMFSLHFLNLWPENYVLIKCHNCGRRLSRCEYTKVIVTPPSSLYLDYQHGLHL